MPVEQNSADIFHPDYLARLDEVLAHMTPEALAHLDQVYGVEHPPEPIPGPTAPPAPGVGEYLRESFAGLQNVPQAPPQSFGAGLAGGLIRGLGSAGSRALAQRQQLEDTFHVKQAEADLANQRATAEWRAGRGRARGEFVGKLLTEAMKPGSEPPKTLERIKAEAQAKAEGEREGKGIGGAGPAADEQFKEMALQYVRTGNFPRNLVGPDDRAAFRQYVHAKYPGVDIAKNTAQYKADQGSLSKMQANLDQVTTSANTLSNSMSTLRGVMNQVPDTGITGVNQIVRGVSAFFGNEAVPQFNQALHVVQNESGRVLGGNWAGGGALLDSEKRDMQRVQSGAFTRAQLAHVMDILESDKIGRLNAGRKQVNAVKRRLDFAESGQEVAPPPEDWYGTIQPVRNGFTVKDPAGKVQQFATRGQANDFIEMVNQAHGY
jgi:hypothetical protein